MPTEAEIEDLLGGEHEDLDNRQAEVILPEQIDAATPAMEGPVAKANFEDEIKDEFAYLAPMFNDGVKKPKHGKAGESKAQAESNEWIDNAITSPKDLCARIDFEDESTHELAFLAPLCNDADKKPEHDNDSESKVQPASSYFTGPGTYSSEDLPTKADIKDEFDDELDFLAPMFDELNKKPKHRKASESKGHKGSPLNEHCINKQTGEDVCVEKKRDTDPKLDDDKLDDHKPLVPTVNADLFHGPIVFEPTPTPTQPHPRTFITRAATRNPFHRRDWPNGDDGITSPYRGNGFSSYIAPEPSTPPPSYVPEDCEIYIEELALCMDNPTDYLRGPCPGAECGEQPT